VPASLGGGCPSCCLQSLPTPSLPTFSPSYPTHPSPLTPRPRVHHLPPNTNHSSLLAEAAQALPTCASSSSASIDRLFCDGEALHSWLGLPESLALLLATIPQTHFDRILRHFSHIT